MTKKNIDFSVLNGKKIYVATPMYGGVATANYTYSLIELVRICEANNIELSIGFIYNESLITRARNVLVANFLESDCDYLFFIDADIVFDKFDFLFMISEAFTNKLDVICAPYPKKTIAWEMIEKAINNNLITNKDEYSKYSGLYGINYLNNEMPILTDTLNEVAEASTGFMLISRQTFVKFKKEYPKQKYIADQHNDGREMFAFFDTIIDKKTKRYLSEDFAFCKYVSDIGIKIWLVPWIKLQHVGQYTYEGSYENFLNLSKIKDKN